MGFADAKCFFDFIGCDGHIVNYFIAPLQGFGTPICLPSPTLAGARLGWAGSISPLRGLGVLA